MADKLLDMYDFQHKYRGLALIIVNKHFTDQGFKKRRGANKDIKFMKQMFTELDFRVKVYKDLDSKSIRVKVKKASEWLGHERSDCFACIVSTHGSEEMDKKKKEWHNVVYGTDGRSVYVKDILDMFDEQHCPMLAGKPKMFFIQSCRSRYDKKDMYDEGATLKIIKQTHEDNNKLSNGKDKNKDETDDKTAGDGDNIQTENGFLDIQKERNLYKENDELNYGNENSSYSESINLYGELKDISDDEWRSDLDLDTDDDSDIDLDKEDPGHSPDTGNMPPLPYESVAIDCPNDSVVMYPVMPGKVAFHNSANGSWMLNYLYAKRDNLVKGERLLRYLTCICGRMSQYEYNPDSYPLGMMPEQIQKLPFKTTGCIIHKLTKDICFHPKADKSIMDILRSF